MWKKAFSQAGLALVTNGVTESCLEVQRLRHMVNRVVALSKDPNYSEIVNALIGDIVQEAPERIEKLETSLDRTLYALACIGEDELKAKIPHSDLILVDETLQVAPLRTSSKLDHEKVARWFTRRVKARQGARNS